MTARYRVESDLVPNGTRWVVKWSHPRWTIAAFRGPGADKSAAQVAKLLNAHALDGEPSKWESPSPVLHDSRIDGPAPSGFEHLK